MQRWWIWLWAALAAALLTAAPAHAEELVVGIKEAPPFVMQEDGADAPRGFAIDLVREIAARLEPPRSVRFLRDSTLEAHLASVASGRVALGIAATSVTAAREKQVDFSNPFFRDTLDAVVRAEGGRVSLWDALRDSDVPSVLLVLAVFVAVTAHVVWWIERGGGGFDRGYLAGVGQGVWWTIVTMSTVGYGDFVPKTSRGRGLGVVVIFVGIALFGVAVASLTAAATAQRVTSPIERLSDLAGMRVGAIPGSIAEQELARRGIRALSVRATEDGLDAVREERMDAFVHDRSQLEYALSREAGGLSLINRPFVQQSYAIAFPLGSPLRKQVNVALQGLREGEDSEYDKLHARWFRSR